MKRALALALLLGAAACPPHAARRARARAARRTDRFLTPFATGATTSLCSFGECPRTTELSLTVPDASPSTIPNGGRATVPIGDRVYHLWVHAEAQTFAGDPSDARCDAATFVPPLPLVLTYVANNLAGLAAGLAAPTQ